MVRLSEIDYESLLHAVHRLECCGQIEGFPHAVLEVGRALVAADRIGFEHIAPTVPEMWGIADPPMTYEGHHRRILVENLAHHPLVKHYYQTGDPSAYKISDFVTKEEWHQTRLYRELFRELECESQMACPLTPRDREFYCLAFYRRERDFTERDRKVLNLFRPHVGQILANLQALNRAQRKEEDQERINEHRGWYVIWIDPRGRIVEALSAAREQLRAFFPEWPSRAKHLPDVLIRWITENNEAGGSGFRQPAEPFIRDHSQGRLVVRFFPRPEDGSSGLADTHRVACLLLEVQMVPVVEPRLRMLGLSDREIQILRQLEHGKTNPEIATRLFISPLTVKKHLENIFGKLNVTSRAGAVAKLHCPDITAHSSGSSGSDVES